MLPVCLGVTCMLPVCLGVKSNVKTWLDKGKSRRHLYPISGRIFTPCLLSFTIRLSDTGASLSVGLSRASDSTISQSQRSHVSSRCQKLGYSSKICRVSYSHPLNQLCQVSAALLWPMKSIYQIAHSISQRP